jgi:hypothetical protein
MIMLFASGSSSGNAKGDFEADWQEFIAGQLGIKGKPELEPVAKKDGWDVVSGGTAFENETGPSAVILRTYSGFGKALSAAAIFNSQDSLPAIEAFASSMKLRTPGPGKQAVNGAVPNPTPVITGDGYTFATSNFDDGWNAAVKSDWVEVTKGDTTVLALRHYHNTKCGPTFRTHIEQDRCK